MKQDKWTQQLHDKLADYQLDAPADLWADIEAALPPQPRRARFVILRRWAVAASVLALVGGGSLFWWQSQQLVQSPSAQAGSKVETPVKPLPEKLIAKADPLPTIEEAKPQKRVAVPMTSEEDTQDNVEKVTEDSTEVVTPPSSLSTDTEPDVQPANTVPTRDKPLNKEVLPAGKTIHDKRGITVGFYTANAFGSQNNSNPVMMANALAENYNTIYAQAASRQEAIFLTGYEEEQHHNHPVSLGLSLSYPLTDRLSLTSGIVYTRLQSDFTQTVRSMQYRKEQTLHYIGIPVGLSYSLWQYKGLNVYFNAAIQADWNFRARSEMEGVEQHVDRDRLQWSASASLGLQYEMKSHLSFFAEPGIGHYFDNGSSVQNFFKDKPTSLKLQFGLRINLK